jgi:predicted RNase H-like HicB family nuclease
MALTAIYERGDGDWWVAACPEIPGAITQGKTLDEARWMLKDAIRELHAARRAAAEREAVAEGRDVILEPLALD